MQFQLLHVGLSENSVPLNPMVLLIIIPMKNCYNWGYTPFSDKPMCLRTSFSPASHHLCHVSHKQNARNALSQYSNMVGGKLKGDLHLNSPQNKYRPTLTVDHRFFYIAICGYAFGKTNSLPSGSQTLRKYMIYMTMAHSLCFSHLPSGYLT